MAASDAAEVVARLQRALAEPGGLDSAADLFATDFVSHNLPPGLPQGVDGVRMWFETLLTAFPDLTVEIEDLFAAGDRVAVATTLRGTHTGELMGMTATGRRVAVSGIDMLSIVDGRIAEHRGLTDTVGLLRQLGGG